MAPHCQPTSFLPRKAGRIQHCQWWWQYDRDRVHQHDAGQRHGHRQHHRDHRRHHDGHRHRDHRRHHDGHWTFFSWTTNMSRLPMTKRTSKHTPIGSIRAFIHYHTLSCKLFLSPFVRSLSCSFVRSVGSSSFIIHLSLCVLHPFTC